MADTTQISASLKQIYGDNLNKKFPLKGSKVLIGRAYDADVRLTNGNISRRHCILTLTAKGWTVQDNSSQNGTFINGTKLIPNKPRPLQCGDIIFLGPPSEMPETFCFEIYYGSEDEEFPPVVECVLENKTEPEPTCNILRGDNLQSSCEEIHLQMQAPVAETSLTESENSMIVLSPDKNSNAEAAPIIADVLEIPSSSTSKNKRKCEMQSPKISSTPIDKQKNSKRHCKLSKGVTDDLDISLLDDQICEVSSSAIDQAEDSQSLLNENIDDVIKLSPRSAENKILKAKLASMSAKIEELQNSKAKVLRICKKAYKTRKQQQIAAEKNLKEDLQNCEQKVKKEILEKFEEDLICNICTELLIKPTVLECSHTFCEFCINAWKKKKNECPMCRRKIQAVTRVLTLENFIDKALQTLTPEQKEKREQLMKERMKVESEQLKAVKSPSRRRSLRSRRGVAVSPRNLPARSSARQTIEISQRRSLILPMPLSHMQPISFYNANYRIPDVLLSDSEPDSLNTLNIYLS